MSEPTTVNGDGLPQSSNPTPVTHPAIKESGLATPLAPTPTVESIPAFEKDETLALQEQTPALSPPQDSVSEELKPVKERKPNRLLQDLQEFNRWNAGLYYHQNPDENFDPVTLAPKGGRRSRTRKEDIVNDNNSAHRPLFNLEATLINKPRTSKPSKDTEVKLESGIDVTSKALKAKLNKQKRVKPTNEIKIEEVKKASDPTARTFGDLKKRWKKPLSGVELLLAEADWYCSYDRDEDEEFEPAEGKRKIRKVTKTYLELRSEDEARERAERERRVKEEKERNRILAIKNARIREAEQLNQKLAEQEREKAKVIAKANAIQANRNEKAKAVVIDNTIKKKRKPSIKKPQVYVPKTPIENAFGCREEYCPFLPYIVVQNDQTPIIPDKFFTSEIMEGNVENVTSFENLITASHLLDSRPEQYHDFKSTIPEDRQRFKIRSCVFPQYEEEYLSRGSLNHGDLDTFYEVGRIMELSTIAYIPPQYQIQVFNKDAPSQSISGRHSKAVKNQNWDVVFQEIDNFNKLIEEIHSKGEFLPYIKSKTAFPKLAIHEILNQVYARSVLPESRILRQYKGFTSEVYGELLPSFISKLFVQTNLDSNSVFLDMGSGVGNVVVQAALEYGAESYGCEMMDNCNILAQKQLVEFEARSKLYGIKPGKVSLFHGDFTKVDGIKEVLARADVILITNFLFGDELNIEVLRMLKHVKLGTRIISLKPVVPDSYTVASTSYTEDDTYISKLKVQRFEFPPDSVSWSSNTGFYYVTEATEYIQSAYLKKRNTRLQKLKNDVYTNVTKKKIPFKGSTFYEVVATSHANVPGTTFSQSHRPMDDQFVTTAEIKVGRAKSPGSRSRSKSPASKISSRTEPSTDPTPTPQPTESLQPTTF